MPGQQFQQVLILLCDQGPQVFDAAGPLGRGCCARCTGTFGGNLISGFVRLGHRVLVVGLTYVEAGGLVGSGADLARQVVGNVHAVGAIEQQPEGGALAALERERENRLGQQEQHLAKHGGTNHEEH